MNGNEQHACKAMTTIKSDGTVFRITMHQLSHMQYNTPITYIQDIYKNRE